MPILNQPFQGQLGNVLIDKIENYDYSSLTIFSAFAKNSGVLRLKSSLEKFKKSTGHIKAFIGIDLDGTSYEALLNLFSLCDELYVMHSNIMPDYLLQFLILFLLEYFFPYLLLFLQQLNTLLLLLNFLLYFYI